MINTPIDWLLKGEPWVEYRARLDLLGQSEDDPQVRFSAPVHVDNASGAKPCRRAFRLAWHGHLQPQERRTTLPQADLHRRPGTQGR